MALNSKSGDRNLASLARTPANRVLTITISSPAPHDQDPAYNGTYIAHVIGAGAEIIYTPKSAAVTGTFAPSGTLTYSIEAAPERKQAQHRNTGGVRGPDSDVCPNCTGQLGFIEDAPDDVLASVYPYWVFAPNDGTGYSIQGTGDPDNEYPDPSIELTDSTGDFAVSVDAIAGLVLTGPVFDDHVLAPGITFSNGVQVNSTSGIEHAFVTGTLTLPIRDLFFPIPCPAGSVLFRQSSGDAGCDDFLEYSEDTETLPHNLSSQYISSLPYADQFDSDGPNSNSPNNDGIENMAGTFNLSQYFQGNVGTVAQYYAPFLETAGVATMTYDGGLTFTSIAAGANVTFSQLSDGSNSMGTADVNADGTVSSIIVGAAGTNAIAGIWTATATCNAGCNVSGTPSITTTLEGVQPTPGTYDEYNGVAYNLQPQPCYGINSASVTGDLCGYQWNPNTHFLDPRDGTVYDSYYDPINRYGFFSYAYPMSSTNNNSSVAGTASVQQADYDLDYGDSNLESFATIQNQYAGGHNGNYPNTSGTANSGWGKTNLMEALDEANAWSLGQHAMRVGIQRCIGLGDCLGNQTTIIYSGGPSSPSDIGIQPDNEAVVEAPNTFVGTCTSGCVTGSQVLYAVPSKGGNGQQGEGRMAIDLTQGIPFNNVRLSGSYTAGGGIVASGPAGATCNLTFISSGTPGTATVTLKDTNTVGTQFLNITSVGSGATSAPTQASVTGGTGATCTGSTGNVAVATQINAGIITGVTRTTGMPPSQLVAPAGTFTASTALGTTTADIIAAPGQGQPGSSGSGTQYIVPVNITTGSLSSSGIVCITDKNSAEQVNAGAYSGITTTGNLISGSAQVTSLSNPTAIAVGDGITGAGIPSGATIQAISGNSLTMSSPALAGGTAVVLTVPAISAIFRYPHLAGATLAQGGTCGWGLELVVDTQQTNPANPSASSIIRTLMPLYGSPDSSHTYASLGTTGAVYTHWTNSNISSISYNSTTTLAATVTGNFVFAENGGLGGLNTGNIDGQPITVAGCTSPELNGTFTAHITGNNSFYYVPNYGTAATTCGPAPTVTFATSQFNLYPRAQVTGVYDNNPSAAWPQQYNSIDGTLALEPNAVPWNVGDIVEEPHWHMPVITDVQNFVQSFTKMNQETRGKAYSGIVTGNVIGDFIDNDASVNNQSLYAGYGGVLTPPAIARSTGGYWGTDEDINTAPNTSLISVDNCKPDSIDKPDPINIPMYNSETQYAVGDLVASDGNTYVASQPSVSHAPSGNTASNAYWAYYSSCSFWNNGFNLFRLPAAYGDEVVSYSPLTSNITFFNPNLACQTTFSGNGGLSFVNQSGGACGVTAPYVESAGPTFKVGGCSSTSSSGYPLYPGVTGGPSSGSFEVPSGASSCNPILTMGEGAVAPNGWSCWMNDLSTPSNTMRQMIPMGSSQSGVVSGILTGMYNGTLAVTPSNASGLLLLSGFTTATDMVASINVTNGTLGGLQILTGGYNAITGPGVANSVTFPYGNITAVSGVASVKLTASNVAAVFSGGTPAAGDIINVGCMAY